MKKTGKDPPKAAKSTDEEVLNADIRKYAHGFQYWNHFNHVSIGAQNRKVAIEASESVVSTSESY